MDCVRGGTYEGWTVRGVDCVRGGLCEGWTV